MRTLLFSLLILGSLPLYADSFQLAKQHFSEKKYVSARNLLEPLSRQGHVNATLMLGYLNEKGLGGKKDPGRALELYLQLANKGVAKAQFNVGMMYFLPKGIKRDYKMAFKWLKLASLNGVGRAHYYIGYMYYNGLHVPQDKHKGASYFWLAKKSGLNLDKKLLQETFVYLRGFLKTLADEGFAEYQHKLGMRYLGHYSPDYLNIFGLPNAKLEEGLALLNKAAQQNYIPSLIALGDTYFYGLLKDKQNRYREPYETVSPDIKIANKFFKKAVLVAKSKKDIQLSRDTFVIRQADLVANSGNINKALTMLAPLMERENPEALTLSAIIHLQSASKGVDKAISRLQTAAKLNNLLSNQMLAEYFEKGKFVKTDLKKSYAYYFRASQLGDYRADYRLFQMYHYGQGTKKDPIRAYDHLRAAARADLKPAMIDMARISLCGYEKTMPLDKKAGKRWLKRLKFYNSEWGKKYLKDSNKFDCKQELTLLGNSASPAKNQ